MVLRCRLSELLDRSAEQVRVAGRGKKGRALPIFDSITVTQKIVQQAGKQRVSIQGHELKDLQKSPCLG